MEDRKGPDEYPWWVKFSLLGFPSRAAQWVFFWLSIVCAVGCVVYGFWYPVYIAGVAFLDSAAMYWATIRWIDYNGVWP